MSTDSFASRAVVIGVLVTGLMTLCACTATLPIGYSEDSLPEDMLQSAEWRAFINIASRSLRQTREQQLAQTCLRAISSTAADLALAKQYDVCIDAAAKSLDAANFYINIDDWKTSDASAPLRPEVTSAQAVQSGILVITIRDFRMDVYSAIVTELKRLPARQRIHTVIIDLRNCPGGVLEDIQETASLFADGALLGGTIGVDSRDIRAAVSSRKQRILPQGLEADLRSAQLLLLVNEKTSSGAELFALGLRRSRSAILLGTRTAGQAALYSVQKLRRKDRALKLREATLVGPMKEAWEGTGLAVDLVLPPASGNAVGNQHDAWLDQAIAHATRVSEP